MNKRNLLVLIAGGSGSGKTRFAKDIIRHFSETYNKSFDKTVQLVSMDNYYNNQDNMSIEERLKVNYDHPDAYDWNKFFGDLKTLVIDNKEVQVYKYNFKEMTHSKTKVTILPSDIIIVEGIFGLYEKRLRDMATLMIYIDTDSDIRLLRRLERDIERDSLAKDIDRFIWQWQAHVKPMHEEFIEPTKRYAHIVVPNTPDEFNQVAFSLLVNMIDKYLVGSEPVLKKPNSKKEIVQ